MTYISAKTFGILLPWYLSLSFQTMAIFRVTMVGQSILTDSKVGLSIYQTLTIKVVFRACYRAYLVEHVFTFTGDSLLIHGFVYSLFIGLCSVTQGWTSDMGDRWSHLCPKRWLFFTNFGQGLSSKVGFFLIFWPILRAGFFDKMLALSNKKSTFVLISGFFGCYMCTFFSKNYLKGPFLTKKAP